MMDYIIEERVPFREIKRPLEEQLDVVGLSVLGISSNCFNGRRADHERDAYNVLLIMKDGTSEVFASYLAK